MAEQNQQQDEGLKELALTSVRSTGFWSFVAAAVGILAVVAGGALFLTIEEIREFAVTVFVIGVVLLFLALVLSPRAIAIFLAGRQGRFGSNVIVMTLAFFVIVILINFLLFRTPTRFDVTATKVFTLSEQTQKILDAMDTTVQANAFFVPGNSATAAGKQQVEDLLNEFSRRNSNLVYRFIDPELQRSISEKYNVTSYPAVVFENVTLGTQQAIATFTEQDFVTGILIVTGKDQKRIYNLTGHNEAAVTRDPLSGETSEEGFDFAIAGMQRDNYRVLPLNLKQTASVPEDAAVLVIAGPRDDLDEDEQKAIIDYILNGGRIIALLDPGTPITFLEIMALWGVAVGVDSIADGGSNVAGQELTPLVQKARAQYFTSASPGTRDIGIADQIDVTFFPEVTSIRTLLPPKDMPPFIRVAPIAMTSEFSWMETDTENVSYSEDEERGPFFVVAVVEASGTIDESRLHALAKFVVIGDSDFAKNKFFSSSDNADLFLNSVNWLADDYELISIRPKVFPYRELVVTTRERDFIKWSGWFFPPLIMLVLGSVVWWRRR
ncbi:MAG: GldG family protein [Chloroflexi bacterium]|nr:GldG family protein [Chloroflexota bacterium]